MQLSRDLGQIRASEPLKLPRLQAPKQNTSNPFPMVSSREVGWRSGKRECRLEIYGRWGRPKYSIIKQLRWPNDAVPWKLYFNSSKTIIILSNLFVCYTCIVDVEWIVTLQTLCCLVTSTDEYDDRVCGCVIVYLVLTRPWLSAKLDTSWYLSVSLSVLF